MRFVILITTALALFLIVFLVYRLIRDMRPRKPQLKPLPEPPTSPEVLLANLRRRQEARSPSDELVTDPREAATILMLEMAHAGEAFEGRHTSRIAAIIKDQFNFTSDQAEALIGHADWASEPNRGETELWVRLIARIMKRVSPKEIIDLDGMLEEVSEIDGLPSPRQMELLQLYRNRTGINA